MTQGGALDALTDRSAEGVLWTRVNSAETFPGVVTPTTWSFYGEALESAIRKGFWDLGIIPAAASEYPDRVDERIIGIFHGRIAVNVDVTRRLMSGLPGVSGDDIERDMLGSVREAAEVEGYPHRLPAVLLKTPWRLTAGAREPGRLLRECSRWWRERVGPDGPREGVPPRVLLEEALANHGRTSRLQGRTRILFQASASLLTALAEQAGEPDAVSSLMSGAAGTDEAAVADDLHLLARDRLPLATFLERHGFHGPNSSELSSLSWREDSRPVERLLGAVRESTPSADRRAGATAARDHAVARLLTALPPTRRPVARMALRFAPLATRLIEHTKTSFLIAGDGGRAATRAIGSELVDAGRLESPDDAFHLFAGELLGPPRDDLAELVAARRELRERCAAIELPETWEGQPIPLPLSAPVRSEAVTSVEGLGASPGVAEGRVRIVRDAADDPDLEAGEVLVCPTTDPSWLGLMTIASALVIDIGAAASHGAIVARELGVPCVIGTRTGTADLRDGDTVRVDGSTGVVEVLRGAG